MALTRTRRAPPTASARAKNRPGLVFKQASKFVGEVVQFHARDLLANKVFYGGDLLHLFAGYDRKGIANALRTAGAPNAMHIILGMMRYVKVDDVTDLFDINSPRRDVGCDHDFVATIAKPVQGFLAFPLGTIRMQYRDGMAQLLKFARAE